MAEYRWAWVRSALIVMTGGLGMLLPTVAPAQLLSEPMGIWAGLIERLQEDVDDDRRGRNGGSRPLIGSRPLCRVNPGKDETVWHVQPSLLLQGDVDVIGVRSEGAAASTWDTVLTMTATPTVQIIQSSTALIPGERYEWLYYQEPSFSRSLTVTRLPFTVMPEGTERDRITADLAALQDRLEAEGANAEAIAQARAEYFWDNNLVADTLQELFAVSEPSEDLLATRALLFEEICSRD